MAKNKIKQFSIRNFRRFEKLDLQFKGDNTFYAVAGRNATGKTSILEAINLAFSQRSSKYTEAKETDFFSDDPIEFQVELDNFFFLSFENPDDPGFERLIPCKKFKKIIELRDTKKRGKIFSPRYKMDWEFEPEDFKRGDLQIDKLESYLREQSLLTRTQTIVRSFREFEPGHFSYSIKTNPFPKGHKSMGYKYMKRILFPEPFYYDNRRERELLPEYNTVFSNIVEDLGWRYKKGFVQKPNKPQILDKVKELSKLIDQTSPYKEDLLSEARSILQDKFNLGLDSSELDFQILDYYCPYEKAVWSFLSSENRVIPATHLGSGLATLIALAISVSFARQSKEPIFFLIDEPELHLETKLKKELFNFLKSLNIQVIVATHSPHFIDQENCDSNIILEELENSISIEYGTQLRVTDLLFRLYAESLDDLLIPEKILIVEGSYDRNLIIKCLELLGGEDLKIQIARAGGKDRALTPQEYEETIRSLLNRAKWYYQYIKDNFKMLVDSDVPESTIEGWASSHQLDKEAQLKRLESPGIEYLYPPTLVKACVRKAGTKLEDGSELISKEVGEIVDIILKDERRTRNGKNPRQADGRVSKQRLNEYVVSNLTRKLLYSPEGAELKQVINWISNF